MKAVLIENLSKTYAEGKKAVDDISLSLEQGEVFGFLGPNGAGKTPRSNCSAECLFLQKAAAKCLALILSKIQKNCINCPE